MKKADSFWLSLEQYLLSIVRRTPHSYTWIVSGIICIMLVASAVQWRNSAVAARSVEDVVVAAALRGDYALAQTLFEQIQDSRFRNQVEGSVYPEYKIEARIGELEQKLIEYPEHREIYLLLSDLYGQLKQDDKSNEYREKARILDPNR